MYGIVKTLPIETPCQQTPDFYTLFVRLRSDNVIKMDFILKQ